MSENQEMPLLTIIIPKDLNVSINNSRPLPLLKNTELKDLRWIDLIQRQNPPLFEALTRRAEYIQLYKIAVYTMRRPLKFQMLESTVGNFFENYTQPPPSAKHTVALVKMPVSEATKEKVVACIERYYESLLPQTPGTSAQAQVTPVIPTPPPTLSPVSFLPPPLPTRTRRNAPPLDLEGPRPNLPNISLCHDSFSTASVGSCTEEDFDNFQNTKINKSNAHKRKQ